MTIFYGMDRNCDACLAVCQPVIRAAMSDERLQWSAFGRSISDRFERPATTHLTQALGDDIGLYARFYPHFLNPRTGDIQEYELQKVCLNRRLLTESESFLVPALKAILMKCFRLAELNSQKQFVIAGRQGNLDRFRRLRLADMQIELGLNEDALVRIFCTPANKAQLHQSEAGAHPVLATHQPHNTVEAHAEP